MDLEKLINKRDEISQMALRLGFTNLAIVIPTDPTLNPYNFLMDYTAPKENYVANAALMTTYLQSTLTDNGISISHRNALMQIAVSFPHGAPAIDAIVTDLARELPLAELDINIPFAGYFTYDSADCDDEEDVDSPVDVIERSAAKEEGIALNTHKEEVCHVSEPSVHNNRKRKPEDSVCNNSKKVRILKEDVEKPFNKDDYEEDDYASSDVPASEGDKVGVNHACLNDQHHSQQQLMGLVQDLVRTNHFNNVDRQPSGGNDKADAAMSMLMAIFTWIKDLPEAFKQQMLTSFHIQQVLEILEQTTHNIVREQLDNKSIEEKFETEYRKYYDVYNCTDTSQEYARMWNQVETLASLGEYNNGMS